MFPRGRRVAEIKEAGGCCELGVFCPEYILACFTGRGGPFFVCLTLCLIFGSPVVPLVDCHDLCECYYRHGHNGRLFMCPWFM